MARIAELLRVVNEQHGTSFRLIGKLAGGTRGAYEVLDHDGRRAVLKPSTNPASMEPLRRVVPLVDHMRAVGYPTPRFLCVGAAPDGAPYHVHEYVPGAPLSALAPAALDMVMALVEQQADRSVTPERSWSTYVRDVV